MAITNISRASNKLSNMLRQKYRTKFSTKTIFEMLKIIENSENDLGLLIQDFTPKNQILLEKHGSEILNLYSKNHGSQAIHSALIKQYKKEEVPAKSTIYRFLKKFDEKEDS